MSKKFLNISNVEQLIEEVKEHPIIYSKIGAVTGIVNNDEKNQAWNKIGKKLNDDPTKLKQKWRNLRDSYQKSVRNKRELEEIGQLHRYNVYRHEDRMSFLLPHIIAEFGTRKRRTKGYSGFDDDAEKKPKIEKETYVFQVESPSEAVEYLLEQDSDFKNEEEEESREATAELIENNEIDDGLETENVYYEEVENLNDSEETSKEQDHQKSFNYPDHHQQKTPTSSDQQVNELDIWLSSLKATMEKFTKLNRARAKREINDIISKYEIQELQQIEG